MSIVKSAIQSSECLRTRMGLWSLRWNVSKFERRCIHYSHTCLSGHSKWSTIKHKKGALDDAKMVARTKLAARITVAVKLGGINSNPRLEQELAHAKAENMPKVAIERAIAKGEPRALGQGIFPMTYEAMLPGGVALVIEAMTDNKARAAAHVKAVVSKFGGSLSKVLYQFVRKGVIIMKLEGKRLDDVFEQVIEVGVEDVEEDEENQIKAFVEPEDLSAKARAFKELGYEIHEVETIWSPLPESQLQLEANGQQAVSLQKVIDDLGSEEVTGVYSNAVIA